LYKSIDDGLNWEKITSSAVDFRKEAPNKIITNDDGDRILLTDKVYILQKDESFDDLKQIFIENDFAILDVITNHNLLLVSTSDSLNSILFSKDKGESFTIDTLWDRIVCLAVDSMGRAYAGSDNWGLYRNTSILTDIESNEQQIFSCNSTHNPFAESTTINFNLESNCEVRLSVYNFLGQEVAVLVNQFLPAGQHAEKFEGTNLPQGTYFYKLQAGGEVKTGKIMLMDN
jgi:hypothetical protein